MAGQTVYCDNFAYYDHATKTCNNPHGPYGEDCDWGKEDEE